MRNGGLGSTRSTMPQRSSGIITERAPELELYLDPAAVQSGDAARVRSLLESALARVRGRVSAGPQLTAPHLP